MPGNARSTVCKRGHDLTDEDNVYVRGDGRRACAPCRAAYDAARRGKAYSEAEQHRASRAAVDAREEAERYRVLGALLMRRLAAVME